MNRRLRRKRDEKTVRKGTGEETRKEKQGRRSRRNGRGPAVVLHHSAQAGVKKE